MNWESVDAFLAMGGYAFYVWGSYAVTLVVLAIEVVMLRIKRRNVLNQLRGAARGRGMLP